MLLLYQKHPTLFFFLAPRKASAVVVKVCGGLEERWTIILHFRGACKVPTVFSATEYDRINNFFFHTLGRINKINLCCDTRWTLQLFLTHFRITFPIITSKSH